MEKYLYTYKKKKIKINTVLVFPNSYFIGMSNLGYQAVFHLLNSNPRINCERAFLEKGTPKIKTLESGREISLFDVILVSISYETDLLNLIKVLQMSGIEIHNDRRNSPLIIIGGIATTIIPYYLKTIADIIVSGDADLLLPILFKVILDYYPGKPKFEILDKLSDIPGIYPYNIINSDTLCYQRPEPDSRKPVHSVILTDKTEFSNRGLIEVSKSCLFNCSFCLVTNAYGRYYPLPSDEILTAAQRFIPFTNKIGLVAATLTNHPDFKMIIKELNKMKFQVSFSAFRIEGLDDELLELIVNNENKTLVIAPEAATTELKNEINKIIPNELILSTISRACGLGIKRLKLYFIIGLPGEKQADIDEIIRLIEDIRKISLQNVKGFGYIPEIIIDINPLVPKPLTLFQGYPMEDIQILRKKIIYLKNKLRGLGRTFVYGESPKEALLQYQIANHTIEIDKLIDQFEL